MTKVVVKVITVDAHDTAVGIKVGDIFNAALEFNGSAHYYVVQTAEGKRHHLLRTQVEGVDKTQL